jgi:D-lactate dehydrogenase (cytochrome)
MSVVSGLPAGEQRQRPLDAAGLRQRLQELVGKDRVSTDHVRRELFSMDFSDTPKIPPAVIVEPETTEEVAELVRICAACGYVIVVRGGGMSYTHGYLPVRENTVMFDMHRMNRVLELNLEDMYITVQAGVTWKQLQGVFRDLPVHIPFQGTLSGERATVGGGLGNNATAVGRGDINDFILGLEVVLGDGRVIQTGSRATSRVYHPMRHYGPDLTGLFISDAGTFGVKTAATFSLKRKPGASSYASFGFRSTETLLDAMCDIQRLGVASENMAFGEYHNRMFANRPTPPAAEFKALLAEIMRMAPSKARGLRDILSISRPGGLRFLRKWKHSLHVTVDGYDQRVADHGARDIKDIARGHGGVVLPPAMPLSLRINPFMPIEVLIVGIGAENNSVPTNRIVTYSRVHDLARAVDAFFAEHADAMQKSRLVHTALWVGSGATVGVEPIIYWRDSMSPLRMSIVVSGRRAELAAIPHDHAAHDSAVQMRQKLVEMLSQFDGGHFQIGKYYPYMKHLRDDNCRQAIRDVKRMLDPDGLINPGGLGL